jgi:glycosyltransferase involved in cell wall biosynthesis
MSEINRASPLVSIVLPTYNGERYIATSIESCLLQTYQNIELIVVVDGRSTDNSKQIVCEYSDPRIRILDNPSGVGRLPGSLNIGFSAARGDMYSWTSDDNYYKQNAIETMVSYLMQNPDVGLVYTGFWFIDEQGNTIRESNFLPPETLTVMNPVGSCFLYRREVAERVGQYDVNSLMVEDVDFWMRIYKLYKVDMVKERYYYHRLHNESLTGKNYGEYLAQRRLAATSKKHFGLSWFRYQQLLADAFINEAFAAYQKKDYRHVLPCILNGTVRYPPWLAERGIYSIGIRSLVRMFHSS